MLVYVTNIETSRIGDPSGYLLAVHDHGSRQEAALSANLNPVRPSGTEVQVWCWEDIRIGLRGCQFGGLKRDLGSGGIGNVPLEVKEAIIGRVQHAQAVCLGFQRDRWICR